MIESEDARDNLPRWLGWARELQTMAQTGLNYARDPYDIARYERMREIAAEMVASGSAADFQHVRELFGLETGHATPKVDVRAAVFQGDSILLVRERRDGKWTLPGGWADPGESPGTAVAREANEESGYEVRVTRLLALYDRSRHGHPPSIYHIYKVFFDCEVVGGAPKESSETDGVGFFPEEALPELSLPRIVPAQIRRLFALHRQPGLPADFD